LKNADSDLKPYLDLIELVQVRYDTVTLQATRCLTKAETNALSGATGKRVRCFRTEEGQEGKRYKWQWKVFIEQPRPAVWKLLRELSKSQPLCISEVHVAMDLSVETEENAQSLREWITQRIVFRYLRAEDVELFEQTRYSTTIRWNRTILVIYNDKPSKFSGKPCVHIEIRMNGATRVKTNGIRDFTDLERLDLVALMKKKLDFRTINWKLLGRRYIRRHNRQQRPTQEECIKQGHFVAEMAARAFGEDSARTMPMGSRMVSAQAVRCFRNRLACCKSNFVTRRVPVWEHLERMISDTSSFQSLSASGTLEQEKQPLDMDKKHAGQAADTKHQQVQQPRPKLQRVRLPMDFNINSNHRRTRRTTQPTAWRNDSAVERPRRSLPRVRL
jgi:hypothetical protein